MTAPTETAPGRYARIVAEERAYTQRNPRPEPLCPCGSCHNCHRGLVVEIAAVDVFCAACRSRYPWMRSRLFPELASGELSRVPA